MKMIVLTIPAKMGEHVATELHITHVPVHQDLLDKIARSVDLAVFEVCFSFDTHI